MFEYAASVIKVIDGDTIDCEVDLGFTVFVKVRFRLYGVNCMETKLGANTNAEQKALGLKAKQIVTDELLGKTVVIKSSIGPAAGLDTDKYGRYLARIYINDEYYNQTLIDRGLAIEYMV
jgi:micrococcal nuclease